MFLFNFIVHLADFVDSNLLAVHVNHDDNANKMFPILKLSFTVRTNDIIARLHFFFYNLQVIGIPKLPYENANQKKIIEKPNFSKIK